MATRNRSAIWAYSGVELRGSIWSNIGDGYPVY